MNGIYIYLAILCDLSGFLKHEHFKGYHGTPQRVRGIMVSETFETFVLRWTQEDLQAAKVKKAMQADREKQNGTTLHGLKHASGHCQFDSR